MGWKGGGSDARRTWGDGQGVDLVRAVGRMSQTAQTISLGHKPRPQAQAAGPGHKPRPQAQATSPGHKPRPQAQATSPDHQPRPQAQTTSQDHRPRPPAKARQPRGKEQTKRARPREIQTRTHHRPRNLNAHARGSFWRARIILRVRKRKIFLGKGSKNRFPGVGPGHGRGGQKRDEIRKNRPGLEGRAENEARGRSW